MSEELPPGWALPRLGELTSPAAPIQYGVLKPGPRLADGVPMLRVTDIRTNIVDEGGIYRISRGLDEEFRRTRLMANDVLISVQGTVGRVAIVPPTLVNANISRTLARIRLRGPDWAPWIRWALLSPQMQRVIGNVVGGTTRDSLNIGDISLIKIPLPPFAEQRRIVARIEALFARIRQARADLLRIAPLAQRFRQRTIAAAVSPSDRDDWQPCTIADVAEVVTGTTPPTANRDYFGGDTPFIKPTDLDAGYHVEGAREGLTDIGLTVSRPIPADTTLLTCIGATIGKTGFARVPCATNQQINSLVPKRYRIEPRWLYWLVVGPEFQESVRANASATTLPILNKGRLERLAVLVPSLEQQRARADRIEAILPVAAVVEHEATRALALLDHLEQSILARAFRGELVPQDPADEPAAITLNQLATSATEPGRRRLRRTA